MILQFSIADYCSPPNYFGTSASRESRGVSASTGPSFWFDEPRGAGWIKRMRMAHSGALGILRYLSVHFHGGVAGKETP